MLDIILQSKILVHFFTTQIVDPLHKQIIDMLVGLLFYGNLTWKTMLKS